MTHDTEFFNNQFFSESLCLIQVS